MDDDRSTDSDEEGERTMLINPDQRRDQDETDTGCCVLSNRDEHQQGSSGVPQEPKGVDSTVSRISSPKAEQPDSTKKNACKAKWPFKQRSCSKTSEKRSLSSSQENLSSDLPRKNVKSCHKFMKYLFPSSCEAKRRERERLLGHPEDQVDNDGSRGDDDEPSTSFDTSSRTYGSVSATKHETLPGSSSQVSKEFEKCKQCSCVSGDSPVPCGHFNLLPPQVITHIFSFLTVRELTCTAALVCKHWWRMSRASCLWLEIRLCDHNASITDEVLISLGSRHRSVRLLNLSDCLKITNNGLSRALSYCGVLRELYLIRCSQLTEGAFLSVAKHCLNLIHLDLSSCTGLTDQSLKSIAEQCPRLQKLRLKQCPHISDLSLQVVASSCRRLKVLTLTDNDKITDMTLESLAKHTHNLEILCLQNCGIHPPGVMQISKLQHLKKLDLSNLSTLTPEAVKLVAKHCTLLDTLNLSLSKEVSDDSVSCVAVSCKRLTVLFLISCTITDRALFSIGENSLQLEHLDISWCSYITGKGAAFVSSRCPRLKYLGLIRCNKVSDNVVEGLVNDHPGIHYSTFLLDSKRLIDKAREQGFVTLE
ncbi:F-box/LRR-repeat protein 17-like [Asterias rubens]|uniref:F-box/LRR-repeat protein 17-like n=1 Tax=Asterias rubens TaxID=7604 RepID=UPI0014550A2C|nr:F-box/LRR-repeat protein 17-like [Asterias rubens]